MSKAHRGKGIRDQFAHGRGECPICKRNNVKILYEQDSGDQKFKICKTCRAAVKNGKKNLPAAAKKEEPAPKETPAAVEKAETAEAAAVTETETAAE